ncbi:WXG100 family type VII secretion target [Amycolatopsis samaneae]|uniref:WXG100 family type VII secretion target n=1 Tax=Amycolatopsis samaneae TaxID=664691 RepID=A0ABW5GVA5_9PSEU
MTGNFLHGETDQILNLAKQTVAHAEDINTRAVTLGNNLSALASSWSGQAHTGFQAVSDRQLGDSQKFTNMLQEHGEKTQTLANSYDQVDADGNHGWDAGGTGIDAAINV